MALRAKKLCSYPGCNTLVASGRCEKHKKQLKQEVSQRRGNSTERGYDWKWRRFREIYLKGHPLCEDCKDKALVEPAVDVHHIKKLANGGSKFDRDNLRALCHECHSVRTRRGE